MPWFLGIRTPGLYDHWCVGNSFYESYLGLYDQNQREVVGQQLDLMKSSGIDGLWIDYQLTSWDSVVDMIWPLPLLPAQWYPCDPCVQRCGDQLSGTAL